MEKSHEKYLIATIYRKAITMEGLNEAQMKLVADLEMEMMADMYNR